MNSNCDSNSDLIEMIDIGNDISLRIIKWGFDNKDLQQDILLVHGLASNSYLWKDTAEHLTSLGHRVVAVDLRGHGSMSSKPDDGYDVTTVTNDIASLLIKLSEQKQFNKPIVLGQSWGGNLVIELAHKFPELIYGIVTVDGGFIELKERYQSWDECENELKPSKLIGKSIDEIRDYFVKKHSDWPQSGLDGMMNNFEIVDNTIRPWLTYDRHLKVLEGLYHHSPLSLYNDITVPVLFVVAEGGRASDHKKQIVEKALTMIKNVKVQWFKADHDLHAQYPKELSTEVHKWYINHQKNPKTGVRRG